MNATKIRLTPNSDVKNLRLEVFACSHYGKIELFLCSMMNSLYVIVTETTTTTGVPCILTEWSDWSPCSRTCGIGYKIRTRNASSTIGCENEQLTEHQSCINRRCQCLLDEEFYIRVFNKQPTDDSM